VKIQVERDGKFQQEIDIPVIPRKGDTVSFENVRYKVREVIWFVPRITTVARIILR
jgi:hypothetical protein